MRLAVIGSGQIVSDFLSVAADVPGMELAAIYGREGSRDKLEALREQFGIGHVHVDYAELLADATVDTVWIALPNSLHFDFAKAALDAGKHVICEKPFVLSVDQLDELQRIASERGLVLVEAISNQYLPNYAWMRDNLDRVGTLKLVQCEYSQYSSRYDAFRSGVALPAFDPAMGGGALMDLGIYVVHFLVGLFGAPLGVTYTANLERGVDTSGVLVLDYPEFTAVGVCAKDSAGPVRTKIQGTDGSMVLDTPPNIVGPVEWFPRGAAAERIHLNTHEHRMVDEFAAFTRIVDTLDLDERDRRLEHSRTALAVAVAALASAGIELG